MWVAFILVTVALVLFEMRLFCVEGHKVILAYWEFGQKELVFFIFLSAACTFLAYQRFVRFGVYRVSHSVLGYLTLKDKRRTKRSHRKRRRSRARRPPDW